MAFHSGFVCIIGLPNAGKSTLLNALAGEKLAIVSPKPQTTRTRVLGVIHVPKQKGRAGAQVVLIDTPGVHRGESSLSRKMMGEVREALDGCDLVLMIVDAARKSEPADQFLLSLVKQHNFQEVIPISARRREGLDVLLQKLIAAIPEGPRYFPDDQITDQPARFMAEELIREQLLFATTEEVPHSVTVIVEQFEEGAKLTRIAAAIFCERESQKGILIGRQGQMLKKVGTAARLEIERMLGTKVFLELFVKVRANWRESRTFVEELDWRKQLEYLVSAQTKPEA